MGIINKLNDSRRAAIIRALVEGDSVRAYARLTDSAKATVCAPDALSR